MKTCHICGKEIPESDINIKVGTEFYCSKCIETMKYGLDKTMTLKKKNERKKKAEEQVILTPSEIVAKLDEYVIGQDIAKQKIAVSIYNHQKMLKYKDLHENANIDIAYYLDSSLEIQALSRSDNNSDIKSQLLDNDLELENVILKSGAGFIVVLAGKIMTMPGLPRVPAAENIDFDENGEIVGIF